MITKAVFLLALFGVTSSKLPHRRRCDPEEIQETPTLCSNYKNILHLDDVQTKLEEKQMMLQERMDAMEGRTRLQLEAANSNISALKRLVTNLSSAVNELEKIKSQTEREFREAKTQLEEHQVGIVSLKREVQQLVNHGERMKGNLSDIEEQLHTNERQLREKKAKLENLETETEARFSDTQRLLNLYKNELSHLNSTALELEVKVKARLEATEMELQAKVEKFQNNSTAFSAKLNDQKAEVDEFKEETEIILRNVDLQLKTQKTTVDRQKAEIDTLKNDTAGLKYRLGSTEEKVGELGKVKLEVNSIKAEGIFTASLKGVYHFSFMTFGYNSHTSGAILVKNGQYQVSTWEFTGPDTSDTTSNTVILELNVRDTVNVILWAGGKIHTSVFTGFLIFPTS
ncbi:hypothetical protein ABVT39_011857 [Epinephelus coioides]